MSPDLDSFGKAARDLSRNPLGIIALFIVLIYGFAALLLGSTVGSLPPEQTHILVRFIAWFPVLVLLAFVWLVAKHHAKLYAPGDYKSDEAFLQTLTPAERILLHERQIEEAVAPAIASPQAQIPLVALPQATVHAAIPDPAQQLKDAQLEASHVNDLVFARLQKEFTGEIQREVKILGTGDLGIFDGVLKKESSMTLVEVKYTKHPIFPGLLIRDFLYRGILAIQRAKQLGLSIDIHLMLIVVSDMPATDKEILVKSVARHISGAPIPVLVRHYTKNELSN